MGIKVLRLIVVCVAITVSVCSNLTTNESAAPGARWLFNNFSLAPFTVVQILNDKCVANNGRYGTCMTKVECLLRGGTTSGICGLDLGVCCVKTATENGVSFGNNTLLYRDEFNGALDITYTIKRMHDQICQFRLDVKSLVLEQPEPSGDCFYDYMTVNQDTKFNKVCGITKDIHYYIDIKDNNVVFTFHVDANKRSTRKWEIYVTQHTCDQGAPNGCGQWYWGTSGTIAIWNNVDPGSFRWIYLDNQEYGICVRWEASYCSITYTESPVFTPKCSDLFERPARVPNLQNSCSGTPSFSTIQTYTLANGIQNFYVRFRDNSNLHSNFPTYNFRSLTMTYQQNVC